MNLTYMSLEKKDRVAVAWFNKPKMNTYDTDLMRDISTIIDEVRFDDSIDICVFASKLDGIWSSGADINLLATSTPEYKAMFCLNCQEVLNKMETTPKLFIAAIDGHCVGGGLEIAMACDLRLACQDAGKIGLPEVNLGELPGTGGTQRLSRLIGKSRAIEMMAKGETFSFERAQELGLVNEVFPKDGFWDQVLMYARQFCPPNKASKAVGNIKRAVCSGLEVPFESGLAIERELQQLLFQSADAKEGLHAYVEKRMPEFRGE